MAVLLRKTMTTLLLTMVVMVLVRGEMVEKEGLTECHNLLGADGREGEGAAVVFCRFFLFSIFDTLDITSSNLIFYRF